MQKQRIIKGINNIGEELYFIRLKDNANGYIHFEGDNPKNNDEVVYCVKEGNVGACIWKEKQGKAFIKQTQAGNLEMVKVREVVGNDSSMN